MQLPLIGLTLLAILAPTGAWMLPWALPLAARQTIMRSNPFQEEVSILEPYYRAHAAASCLGLRLTHSLTHSLTG